MFQYSGGNGLAYAALTGNAPVSFVFGVNAHRFFGSRPLIAVVREGRLAAKLGT